MNKIRKNKDFQKVKIEKGNSENRFFIVYKETDVECKNYFERDFMHQSKQEMIHKRIPSDLFKYYVNRYNLFSKFDKGIQLDYESWFSVCPEPFAKKIAEKYSKYHKVADFCCGCGGNSIQFALNGQDVYSFDVDQDKLERLVNNAEVYGVSDKVKAINFSILDVDNIEFDMIYCSPPWGGINYQNKYYSLLRCIFPNILLVIEAMLKCTNRIVLMLPKNTDVVELIDLFSYLKEKHDLKSAAMIVDIIKSDRQQMMLVQYGDFPEISEKQQIIWFKRLLEQQKIFKSKREIAEMFYEGRHEELFDKLSTNQLKNMLISQMRLFILLSMKFFSPNIINQ